MMQSASECRRQRRLAGKVAVITGATSDIGHQIAYRFAQEGAHLVCTAAVFGECGAVLSLR